MSVLPLDGIKHLLRIRVALERRNHPDVPPPSPAVLFVVSRAVLGAIRAAVLEDSDLPGTGEFEDALVRLAEGMLSAGTEPAS